MDNNELLQQVVSLIQEQTATITDIIDEKINDAKNELYQEIRASETRINIKIENDVTKRIDVLFDGYKLTHEKQWELERRVENIERKLGLAI